MAVDVRVIERSDLSALLVALREAGYEVIAPVPGDGSIDYDVVTGDGERPAGFSDEQGPGAYRLKMCDHELLFDFAAGASSWKKFLFPPSLTLFSAQRRQRSFEVLPGTADPPPRAFLGVRACDLAAIDIQDKIFLGGAFVDPSYRQRRKDVFIVAVNCTRAGGSCFCASMGTGPRVSAGFDLALTELKIGERHCFTAEPGSDRGEAVLARLGSPPAGPALEAEARSASARCAASMARQMVTDGLRDLLVQNQEHPRWRDVASRCLACANCTLVCPTCFCATVQDVTDLAGERAERIRVWDSCFSAEHSHLHGASVRRTTRSRYRQWMTHKLAYWIDQFGTSGCVGCGRCITWCPAGIDITEEAAAIRAGGATTTAPNSGG
ncbi:MAG: 4Fe-4S dicluster domain-containing protein [Candidatus Schekmanbacteria bacterium]|nr:4Fe-4S dicluster domain-containing protein [Candidatus Schekmanbacteria bacterium]